MTTIGESEDAHHGGRLRRAIDAHLGSRDVARVIYGSIIGLAVVVALEPHPPGAATMASYLIGTALAVALAEIYSEFVGTEARSCRRRDDIRIPPKAIARR